MTPTDLGIPPERPLTMQDRLLVNAHAWTLERQDPSLRPIMQRIIECVRCCDGFPDCGHVDAEAVRVTVEEAEEITREAASE